MKPSSTLMFLTVLLFSLLLFPASAWTQQRAVVTADSTDILNDRQDVIGRLYVGDSVMVFGSSPKTGLSLIKLPNVATSFVTTADLNIEPAPPTVQRFSEEATSTPPPKGAVSGSSSPRLRLIIQIADPLLTQVWLADTVWVPIPKRALKEVSAQHYSQDRVSITSIINANIVVEDMVVIAPEDEYRVVISGDLVNQTAQVIPTEK